MPPPVGWVADCCGRTAAEARQRAMGAAVDEVAGGGHIEGGNQMSTEEWMQALAKRQQVYDAAWQQVHAEPTEAVLRAVRPAGGARGQGEVGARGGGAGGQGARGEGRGGGWAGRSTGWSSWSARRIGRARTSTTQRHSVCSWAPPASVAFRAGCASGTSGTSGTMSWGWASTTATRRPKGAAETCAQLASGYRA